jgi:hypothetical protein
MLSHDTSDNKLLLSFLLNDNKKKWCALKFKKDKSDWWFIIFMIDQVCQIALQWRTVVTARTHSAVGMYRVVAQPLASVFRAGGKHAAICSSVLVLTYQTMQLTIPDNCNLNTHHWEKTESLMTVMTYEYNLELQFAVWFEGFFMLKSGLWSSGFDTMQLQVLSDCIVVTAVCLWSEFLPTQRRCIMFPVRYELNLYMLCRRK